MRFSLISLKRVSRESEFSKKGMSFFKFEYKVESSFVNSFEYFEICFDKLSFIKFSVIELKKSLIRTFPSKLNQGLNLMII